MQHQPIKFATEGGKLKKLSKPGEEKSSISSFSTTPVFMIVFRIEFF